MRLEIIHDTTYIFSEPVFLEPHVVRLQPHSNASQRLHDFSIETDPVASGRTDCNDIGGTTATLWFDGLTERLTVRVRSDVETLRENPFDFIITDPLAIQLPVEYARTLQVPLKPYMQRRRAAALVDEYAQEIAQAAGGNTQAFLSALSARMYDEFDSSVREHGNAWPASRTLRQRRGACRDLAVLFVDACRSQGMAARFVSGYLGILDEPHRHLHAWAEVYLPGAGWRGYDPTSGLAVGKDHVSVAYAAVTENAAPITGSFRKTGATASVAYRIAIRALE